MSFSTRANQIIPGYALLTDEQRQAFEATEPGRVFAEQIHEHENQSFFQWLRFAALQSDALYQEKIYNIRRSLILMPEYKQLLIDIKHAVLADVFSDFHWLNDDQKKQLASANCSRVLFPDVPRLMAALDDWNEDACITHQLDEIFSTFERQLATDPEMAEIRNQITREKNLIQEKAKHNAVKKLFHPYNPDTAPETEAFVAEEYEQLTLLIATILQANTPSEMALHAFNQEQAQGIADHILTSFENEFAFDINDLLREYAQSLQRYVTKNLGAIPGEINPFQAEHSTQQNVEGLLSFIYTHSVSTETQEAFFSTIDQLADAHAFIQASGFATQNETSHLSWIDMYNYTRSRQYIADAKNDLFRFFNPFIPLIAEWRNINKYEKNVVLQIVRTLIPILIMAAVIILVATLLSPIAIPEAASILILIPTLYVGALIATGYVLTRDNLHKRFRQWYYGGEYAIPEYQVNARMKIGFTSPEQASQVRDFYILELDTCYKIETQYQTKDPGTLSDTDMAIRKKNAERKDSLHLEWYDIHTNPRVGSNRIKEIALKRIQTDGLAACAQSSIKDAPGIQAWADAVVTDIKSTLHHTRDNRLKADLPQPARNRFFPACMAQQEKAETLHALKKAILAPSHETVFQVT